MSDSLTFRLLRYIKAAAETLNFTRAAEQVFVAQSSLSHQIGKFEDPVELLIFDRLQNGLKLTPAGRILATYAEKTLKEWEQTLAMASVWASVITFVCFTAAIATGLPVPR